MTTDIFMITYPRDYAWLAYYLRSVDRYARTSFRELVLVIERQDAAPKKLPGYARVERCRNYRRTNVAGYAGQAIECLRAHERTDADVIWFAEADTPFIRHMSAWPVRKPPLVYLPWDKLGPEKSGLGDPGATIWRERTELLTGMAAQVHTTLWPPFVYPRCVLEKAWEQVGGEEPLRAYSKQHGSINQHDILGTVALKFFPGKMRAYSGESQRLREKIPSPVVRHYWMKRDPSDPEIQTQLRKDGIL